ncbi:hepcidin-like [Mugil cephalus]|uniref:hepcidin-like n=1 Tax=Mugil cephalus TaxID=48193 RepID=UPI001FB59EBC|nr:hepcidin-like [Mugil cephalus]
MKACRIAVALVLTFTCIPRNSAFPFATEHEMEEPTVTDNPDVAYEDGPGTDDSDSAQEEASVETWMLPYNLGQGQYKGPVRCRYCCGCCGLGVCGVCCK